MSGFNFNDLMSPDQIELAHEASAIAHDQIKGANLYKALKVGEAILIGSTAAMEASGSNRDNGYLYARAFKAWKAQFGFDTVPPTYLDDCKVCAKHRTISDEIIAGLKPGRRANIGVSGLAKRVRQKLRELTGEKVAQRASPHASIRRKLADTTSKLAHVEEQLAAVDEDPAPTLDRRLAGWAKALAEAGLRMDEEENESFVCADDRAKFDAWVAEEQAGFEDTDNKTYYPNPRLLEAARAKRRELGIGVEAEQKRVAKATGRSSRRVTTKGKSKPPAPSPAEPVAVEAPKPAVAVKDSITSDYIVCLEDGLRFTSLTRHLRTEYDLSPEEYREKWGLPSDYPMTIQAHAKAPR